MSGYGVDFEEDNGWAAEYVLGLLSPEEHKLAEERMEIDPAFKALVLRWTEDFAAMTEDVPAITPPKPLERLLIQRLFPDAAPPPARSRLAWLWPVAALGGLAAAAVAAVLVLNPGVLGRGGEPEYLARLASQGDALVVEARFDADTNRLDLQRLAGEIPEGRDLELWLVRMEDGAPVSTVSLGVIPRDPEGVVDVSAELAAEFPGNALALSDEPLGGSPTGQATGPVVAIGPLTGL
jgi:anti-sigma-K factor RskA